MVRTLFRVGAVRLNSGDRERRGGGARAGSVGPGLVDLCGFEISKSEKKKKQMSGTAQKKDRRIFLYACVCVYMYVGRLTYLPPANQSSLFCLQSGMTSAGLKELYEAISLFDRDLG